MDREAWRATVHGVAKSCTSLSDWSDSIGLYLLPVASISGHCFHFDFILSFFLELFLHLCPYWAYWAPTNLGSSSFSVLSFCLFMLFMGFSRQGYWCGLPFPSPVDSVLSELSHIPVCLGWPYMAWFIVSLSYRRLCSTWSIWLVFVIVFVVILWWRRIRGLWKLPNGRDWLREKLGLVLLGGAMVNKSLIQFSLDAWGSVPSLLFDLRPNYAGSNEDNGDLHCKAQSPHFCTQCPDPAAGHFALCHAN